MKRTLLIIILILLILLGVGYKVYDNKLEQKNTEIRAAKVKNAKLEKVSETQSRKIIADSLTKKELKKVVDSLEFEYINNPKIVTRITTEIKEIEKPIDNLEVKDSLVFITDNYPSKDNPFIIYSSLINTNTKQGTGNFYIRDLTLDLVISQNEDTTWQLDTKFPEFVKVKDIQVQAIPLEKEKPDNFGFLAGGGVNTDLSTGEKFLGIDAGIRYKKVYLLTTANTINQVGLKALIEF